MPDNQSKFLSAFGEDVKRLRAGRSQKETADAADMTQSRLSDIEAGKVNLTISKLLDIAAALKKSLEIRFR
jgi:transcriptional regulator with XRE-family HTH domain